MLKRIRLVTKEAVKKVLKSTPVGRTIYSPLQNLIRLYTVPLRRKRLQVHGYKAMEVLNSVADRYNIPYFASYGTLLGFVRDHEFIKHDDDIDLGIIGGELSPVQLLEIFLKHAEGFEFVRALEYQEKITEITLSYREIYIDLFFYQSDEKGTFVTSYYWDPSFTYPSAKENSVRLIYQAEVKELKKMNIQGVEVSIPANSEELLASQYGENWRVPDQNWRNENHPGVVNVSGYGYSVALDRVYSLEATAKSA